MWANTDITMLVEIVFCFAVGIYSEENGEWHRSLGSCQGQSVLPLTTGVLLNELPEVAHGFFPSSVDTF